mmetsp:Transcript_35379/g.87919  ORF Transcript_35379/g.87919 Transcript_35379/m.87919 type:complete len:130 (-) Transcript_35379:863-1252(-)
MHSSTHPSIHGSHASVIHAGTHASPSPHASNARPYLLSSFETVGDLKTGPIHTHTHRRKHLQTRQDKKTVPTKCGVRERERERKIDTAQASSLCESNPSFLSSEAFLRSFVLTSPSHSPIHPSTHLSVH